MSHSQPAKANQDATAVKVHPNKLSAVEQQRHELERLLQKADKPVAIPEIRHKALKPPPEIVKNVSGSSAGAGSAEFHIYRNHRRYELSRLELLDQEAAQEREMEEFQRKRQQTQEALEAETAKRRAKRQKRKQNLKKRPVAATPPEQSSKE
ncbi:hypothetical protein BJ085DRAFT_15811 [Dimargaris cristalligena]|uniref:Uncharacterized protein n=1 Tax=Dimargaris cristalligena TaxID=215637 RepID=A0A4P9ZW05_9FUNG|nr:hypothetical protein BJ085DRAFT_15811 [Dimargaris cristalligena]|eukprot:RKP36840.1 hypothetical protein BJ085DRAFT_15811 [Dimargaris cristalligena]